MSIPFKALVVEKNTDGQFQRSVQQWTTDKLPAYEVLIKVKYSSLNYKDALSASGHKGITRQYPHIPGIDAAGIVEESEDPAFQSGDRVIVTSYDLGQNTAGGFGRYIRVPASWIIPLPDELTLYESMALGTAGLTAAIGIHHLRHHGIVPRKGPVLVTGATGGVGTMALGMLAKLGYEAVAATGKNDQKDFLKKIGASLVISRDDVKDERTKPLLSSAWGSVIDTVGGPMLDTAIRQTAPHGVIACCGNIAGDELHTSIYPFILRGVVLAGIDSGNCEMDLRRTLWQRISAEWKPDFLSDMARTCSLEGLDEEIEKILQGSQTGRVVLSLDR